MGMPLKVSDSLFAVAKQEAQASQRSITAQVEHWARIGRAVEAILAHRELLGVKGAGELLSSLFPSPTLRQEVHDLLMRVATTTDREAVKTLIRAGGTPLYTTDPDRPGLLVQVLPDGTRTPGRMENRRFVPLESGTLKSEP